MLKQLFNAKFELCGANILCGLQAHDGNQHQIQSHAGKLAAFHSYNRKLIWHEIYATFQRWLSNGNIRLSLESSGTRQLSTVEKSPVCKSNELFFTQTF
jgi:hypothetical protein